VREKMSNENITIEFTPKAMETLSNIRQRIAMIGNYLGDTSPEYVKAASSFVFSFQAFLSLRPKMVTSDGELSLYGTNGYMDFGLNDTRQAIKSEMAKKIFGDDKDRVLVEWSVNS
jgi:hypothetical protein